MSHVIVVNSYARTVKVATTPVTYLTEVRDEACQKFGVSKDQFTLKYNNKPVTLSQQIRLANLPQGARLELVQASRSPTVISVALQLPVAEKNTRLTQKFASTTSLWEILRQFESSPGPNYNFTQRGVPEMSGTSGAGRLNYEMPVITVMPSHKEQSSFVGLQQTLNQLGFDSGSVLLKLSYRNSGTPLEEAMTQISQYFKTDGSANPRAGDAHIESPSREISIPSDDQVALVAKEAAMDQTTSNEEPEPMEIDTEVATKHIPEPELLAHNPSTANIENIYPNPTLTAETPTTLPAASGASAILLEPSERGRNVQIFSAPTSSTPQAARKAFNESDYLPTIEHAKIHQAALLNKTRNQRLPSDKELEEQEREKQEKINAAADKGGALRIRMPDGALIQMDFTKVDTADGLYEFVKSFLEKKKEPFKLNYTGPTGRLVLVPQNNKRLIQDLRFFNNELITFQWADDASPEVRASRKALAQEWQAKAQTLKVEEVVSAAEPQAPKGGQTVAEGKKKAGMSSEEKESKLKSLLGKSLFKKK